MSKPYCEYAFDHEPGTTCEHCQLPVSEYGNTEEDFDNCSFPCCGCDGSRLCMARNGPSDFSNKSNVEGMWNGTPTPEQRKGRMDLIAWNYEQKKKEGTK